MAFQSQTVSWSELYDCLASYSGQRIERLWFGDYLAMYLEIGPSTGFYKSKATKHEHGFFIGYDWLVRDTSGTTLLKQQRGAGSSVRQLFEGAVIESVTVLATNELRVQFQNQSVIESQSDEGEDPSWDAWEAESVYWALQNGTPVRTTCFSPGFE